MRREAFNLFEGGNMVWGNKDKMQPLQQQKRKRLGSDWGKDLSGGSCGIVLE